MSAPNGSRRDLKPDCAKVLPTLRSAAAIFDNAGWGFAVHDAGNDTLALVNRAYAAMHKYTVDELIGKPMDAVFPPEFIPRLPEVTELVHQRGHHAFEAPHVRKDGTRFPVRAEAVSVKSPRGRVCYRAIWVQDITEQKRAEEALRESEERFRRLAENAPDMIFRYRIAEPVGFEYVNPAITSMAGYRPDQYYADPRFIATVIHPDDREAFAQMIRDRQIDPVELRWLRSDGSVMWTEQRNTLAYDDAGELIAIEGIVRDITGRKSTEEELREAREALEERVQQRLESGAGYGLTFRELTVLTLVADGKADKEIAVELGISPLTVQKHLSNILGKMRATSRTEAGVRGVREGLLP